MGDIEVEECALCCQPGCICEALSRVRAERGKPARPCPGKTVDVDRGFTVVHCPGCASSVELTEEEHVALTNAYTSLMQHGDTWAARIINGLSMRLTGTSEVPR